MNKRVMELAAYIAVVGAVVSTWHFIMKADRDGIAFAIKDSYNIMTGEAARFVPSSVATDDGFSNYARRDDVSEAFNLRLGSEYLSYGQVNPL